MAKLKTLTPYYGGKFNKVGKFISQILPVHRHYIEPCGGMAGVLMQKEPSFCEVYNDIDDNLVTLFEVVRDPFMVKELSRRLDYTPYSKEEWKRCRSTYQSEKEKVEKARKVYVLLSMGFLGSLGNKSFSFGGPKYQSSQARTFFNGLDSLPSIHRRIKNLVIDKQEALEVAKKWDTKDSCIYWDPPYLKETRKTFKDYAHEMTSEQHQNILDFVTSCKSKIIISSYPYSMYEEALEPNGFHKIELETYSRGAKQMGDDYDSDRTECIWLNYKPKDYSNPLFACLKSHV